VDSVAHKDKRANIPTEELRDFIAYEEKAPDGLVSATLVDLQLVWKGKDEQEPDLAFSSRFIFRSILPQVIIDLQFSPSPVERSGAGPAFVR
jgi:adenine-specific DNA-methyltransferase